MATGTVKKLTSFRLSETLLNILKIEAKKENRSLSNYVECVLTNTVYREPNKATLESIIDARAGRSAGIVNTSSIDALIQSCEE